MHRRQVPFLGVLCATLQLLTCSRAGATTIEEFPVPTSASNPTAITAGPDGNVWFTEQSADKIGQITPAGAITEYDLAPGARPAGIVTGPDGNYVWFTESGTNMIARVPEPGTFALVAAAAVSMLCGGRPRIRARREVRRRSAGRDQT